MWRIASIASLKLTQRNCKVKFKHNEVMRASSFISVLPWKSSSCKLNTISFEAENFNHPFTSSDRRDNRRFSSSTKRSKQYQPQKMQVETNRRIIAFGKINDWTAILDLYEKEKLHFDEVNYATAMTQLGRIRSFNRHNTRLEPMLFDIATQLQIRTDGSWGAQAMANVIHAVAKMKLKSDGTKRLVDSILGDTNLQTLIEHSNCQEIVNTAWACATMGIECPPLFQAIDSNALYLVKNGTSQNVGTSVWACATLGIECPLLFTAIDNNALNLVENGNSQDIANTAWACATLRVECPSLFKAIDKNAWYLVENGTSLTISNTAWACATLGIKCPSLFKAIDNSAVNLVENGSNQDIANIAWACATLRVECPSLIKAIDNNALHLVKHGNSQDIAKAAWACATLGVECPSLFTAIDKNALYLVVNGNSQEIVNTAWACATLGVECPSLFRAIDYHMETLLDSCTTKHIAMFCYSFAISDLALDHEPIFCILWNRAIRIKSGDLNPEISWQLLQTFVLVSRVMQLPPPTELLKNLDSLGPHENHDSHPQREMSQLLNEMGVSHEMEASPFPAHTFVKGLLAIDVACKERRLAIEFDGPSHFLKTISMGKWLEGRVENGPTKAKHRFLKRLGWKVVHVRYWEWESAKSKDEKKKLLRAKLLAANIHSLT